MRGLADMVVSLRQRREQMAEARSRLAHVQPLLNFPYAGRHRVHHRHLQVLLQRLDDIERAPAGAEHVDRVGALHVEEIAFDVPFDKVQELSRGTSMPAMARTVKPASRKYLAKMA